MFIKGLSLLFLGLGVFVLMQVALPVLEFKAFEMFAFANESALADPNPKSVDPSDIEVENSNGFSKFVVKNGFTQAPYKIFQLTIPKLQLNSVKVAVNSNDFEQNLSHLPGSVLPGQKGNIFITGHSGLDNSILAKKYAYFVNLPNIKRGDEIILTALGQPYKYVVEGLKIVDPRDTSVVKPPDSTGRYVSLMTCVPPGFSTKRLVVLAKLKN